MNNFIKLWEIEMTIVNDILELLETKELTAEEISKKLKVDLGNLRTYLITLRNKKYIVIVNDKKPYKYKNITQMAKLKRELALQPPIKKSFTGSSHKTGITKKMIIERIYYNAKKYKKSIPIDYLRSVDNTILKIIKMS